MRPNVRIYPHTELGPPVLKISLFCVATHTHIPHMAAPGVNGPVFKIQKQAETGKGSKG